MIARARRSAFAAAGLAVSLTFSATPARSQNAGNADVQRAILLYRAGNLTAAVSAIDRIAADRLSPSDRAIAQLHKGLALLALHRDTEGTRALTLSIANDPRIEPDPAQHSTDLVRRYRLVRAAVPVVSSFRLVPAKFNPAVDSLARLEYTMENEAAAGRRGPAIMQLSIINVATGDSTLLWSGREGETFKWDGKIRSRTVTSGRYQYVLSAMPDEGIPVQARQPVTINVRYAGPNDLLPAPALPTYLPESVTYAREDTRTKSHRFRTGLVIGSVGVALAVGAVQMVQPAIDQTEPGSGRRKLVAGMYASGLVFSGVGAVLLARGYLGRFRGEVSFVSPENVRRNREMRDQYQADLQKAQLYNAKARGSLIIEQRYEEGTR